MFVGSVFHCNYVCFRLFTKRYKHTAFCTIVLFYNETHCNLHVFGRTIIFIKKPIVIYTFLP